jgi:hypothetical protein
MAAMASEQKAYEDKQENARSELALAEGAQRDIVRRVRLTVGLQLKSFQLPCQLGFC